MIENNSGADTSSITVDIRYKLHAILPQRCQFGSHTALWSSSAWLLHSLLGHPCSLSQFQIQTIRLGSYTVSENKKEDFTDWFKWVDRCFPVTMVTQVLEDYPPWGWFYKKVKKKEVIMHKCMELEFWHIEKVKRKHWKSSQNFNTQK